MEHGHLNESLLNECMSLPGNLFAINMLEVGVVVPLSEGKSILSLLKV